MNAFRIEERFKQSKLKGTVAILAGIALAATAHPAAASPAARHMTERVIVKPFDRPQSFQYDWKIAGNEIADMMTTDLVNAGVDVMERENQDDLEKEKEEGMSGTTSEDSAPAMGQALGGQIMVVGRITEFGVSEKKKSFGGGLIPFIGKVEKSKYTARVVINGRLVEIRTGRTLAAVSAEATEENGSTSVGGILGGVGGGGFSSSSTEWTQSMLGKATRKAVDDFVAKIAPRIPDAIDAPSGDAATRDVDYNAFAGIAALRKMTCVVLIPETHLTRAGVPDPAAETEMMKQLLAAGIPVKDDARLRALRDQKWVLAAAHGDLSSSELLELKDRYGADILIVGEAVSERTEKTVMDTNSVFCRGRVQLKAIRMDTASIIAADDAQKPGRDLSEILASKDAFKNAARAIAPGFIKAMAANLSQNAASSNGSTVAMEMEIGGFGSLGAANDFLVALGKVSGIGSADFDDWKGGILFAKLQVKPNMAKRVGILLETDTALARFKVRVTDSNGAKVQGTVRKP